MTRSSGYVTQRRCFVLRQRIRRAAPPKTCMAALCPLTEEALWRLAVATPGGGRGRRLAGTHTAGTEGEGYETSSRHCVTAAADAVRTSQGEFWGSGAERKRAHVTNMTTAAGREKKRKEEKHFCGSAATKPPRLKSKVCRISCRSQNGATEEFFLVCQKKKKRTRASNCSRNVEFL